MGATKRGGLASPDPLPTAFCQPKKKPDVLEDLIRLLRKLLDYCLCCLTCGCYPGPRDPLSAEVYDAELMEEEREAVHNLLKYLNSDESKEPTISDERLRALCILTYSDNDELQRSAALCFAELSDRMQTAVPEIVLEPLVVLLRSRDPAVQKAASLAMSNFAINGPESNKMAIANTGAIKPLIQLLYSRNIEVQCNTCGCITTLATNDTNKHAIVQAGGIRPLLTLAKSNDVRVQRNATGALLNLTHLQSNRDALVEKGALPVLVEVLHSDDPDVQYYCTAALSNLAVTEKHRAMMSAIGHYDVIRRFITLLLSRHEKVKCQACLALRNLASDGDNQITIVRLRGLHNLHIVVGKSKGETLTAALACLRNLSIHKANERSIISETFLEELQHQVRDSENPEAQAHAAGTIRNLAAGDEIQAMGRSGCLQGLLEVLESPETENNALVEVTAALAVLADEDEHKDKLVMYGNGSAFLRLIDLATNATDPEIQYNCAGTVGQLALTDLPVKLLSRCEDHLLVYLDDFLHKSDESFVHIALWTCVQLLKFPSFVQAFTGHKILAEVQRLSERSHNEAIQALTFTILEKVAPQSSDD